MTEPTPQTRYGVTRKQVATALQNLGYRGLVDETAPYVQSAAMGLDFRIQFYSPNEDEQDPHYASYMFDMGLYSSEPVTLERVIAHCNSKNWEYRYVRFYGGQNDAGRCYAAVQMDVVAESDEEAVIQRYCSLFVSMANALRDLLNDVEGEIDHVASSNHEKAVSLIHGSTEEQMLAAELYYSAAKNGFSGSQNNLGDLYERGKHMPQSPVVAAYWYARAAERGEPTAYLSLATLLASAAEDNWTYIEAAKFAYLAVERLHEGSNKVLAQTALDRLVALLPEEAMSAAKEQAEKWTPLFQEKRLMSDPPSDPAETAILLN